MRRRAAAGLALGVALASGCWNFGDLTGGSDTDAGADGTTTDAGAPPGDAATDADAATLPHGTCLWSHSYGDALPQYGGEVATNGSGDIFVSESFGGTVDFGGGPLASEGGNDIALARFDSSGRYLAAERFGDPGEQEATAITVNGIGDVFMTGPFLGTLDFGDAGGGVLTANGDGLFDTYLVQIRNQVPIWSTLVGGPGAQITYSVAADPNKGALLPGTNQGTVNVAGNSFPISVGASSEAFAAHLLSTQDWSKAFPSSISGSAVSGAYDSAGNVILAGSFSGSAQFGGAPLDGGGGLDAFVAKYDGTGAFIWRKGFGNPTDEQATAVATHGTHAVVAGNYSGTINFGGKDLTAVGSNDIFVLELDQDGNHVFSASFGGAANDDARAIAVDAAGNIYVGGFVYGDADLGDGVLKSAGGSDIFLLELDPNGKPLFGRLYGDAQNQNLYFGALAIAPDGNIVITPQFAGTVDFGCGTMTSAGAVDLAVVKLSP